MYKVVHYSDDSKCVKIGESSKFSEMWDAEKAIVEYVTTCAVPRIGECLVVEHAETFKSSVPRKK